MAARGDEVGEPLRGDEVGRYERRDEGNEVNEVSRPLLTWINRVAKVGEQGVRLFIDKVVVRAAKKR